MMDFRREDIAKQKAYDLLRDWIKLVARHTNPDQNISELLGWLWKLKPPVLDSETGLVPCGCGGKPYQSGPKNNSCWMYTCADCLITTEPQPNNAWAKQDWNNAMGYHPEEGAE